MKDFFTFLGALFLFSFLQPTKLEAVESCAISEVQAAKQPCINGQFYIDLSFTVSDQGASGFSVAGNGTDYGNFDYGQAYYTFGPFNGDGTTPWEFVVTDIDNPACSDFTELGIVDCNPMPDTCVLTNIVANSLECASDSTMGFFLNFTPTETGNLGFDLEINGSYFASYAYTDLPVTLFDFPLSGNGTGNLEICDKEKPNCCTSAFYSEPDCKNPCQLDSLVASALDCNEDGTYILQLELSHTGYEPTDSFEIFSTGNYLGVFPYSQSTLSIPDFTGSGNDLDEITICHQNTNDCCLSISFDAPVCDENCFISEIILAAENCENGEYYLSLDLKYHNPGFLGFQVLGNGTNYGIFQYPDLPIQLGPFTGDSLLEKEFVVLDQVNPLCANLAFMKPVLCFSTNLNEKQADGLQIFTNASTDLLSVNFENKAIQITSLNLFNMLGQSVKYQRFSLGIGNTQMDLSGLASGIYIVVVEANNGLMSRKFYHD